MKVASHFEVLKQLPLQSRRKNRAALMCSFVFHVLLLATIYLLIFLTNREPAATGQLEQDRRAEIVLVSKPPNHQQLFQARVVQQTAANGSEDTATTPRDLSDMLPTGAELTALAVADLALPIDQRSALGSQPVHHDLLSRGKLAGFAFKPPALSAEDAALVAAEQERMKSLLPQGDPVQVSLFGVGETPAHTFVFLLDRSKSMGESDLNVLESAKAEVLHAVHRLGANHRFQVIAYNEKTMFVGPQRQMLKPAAETMHQVRESITAVYAAGGTSHTNALSVAIGLQPDVIFLLTDAGSPTPSMGEIRQIIGAANREMTTIHAVHFGNELDGKAAGFLAELSRATGGESKYVRANANSKNHPKSD